MNRHWLRLNEGETLLAEVRKSGWALIPALIWASIIGIVGGAALGGTPRIMTLFPQVLQPSFIDPIRWFIFFLVLLALYVLVLRKVFRWMGFRSALTSHRVVIRSKRQGDGWEIPLISIVRVDVFSGFFKQMVGVSTVSVTTNFTHESAMIPTVQQGPAFSEAISAERHRALSEYYANLARQHDVQPDSDLALGQEDSSRWVK